jgi:hypothetical protein
MNLLKRFEPTGTVCLYIGEWFPLSGLLFKQGLLLAGVLVATDALFNIAPPPWPH